MGLINSVVMHPRIYGQLCPDDPRLEFADQLQSNLDLYTLERAEYEEFKDLAMSGSTRSWHRERLAEVSKGHKQAKMEGYWPHCMRKWKNAILAASDSIHLCTTWAQHSKDKGYYCVECGTKHDTNEAHLPEVCDWKTDAYYVAFFDYINRTKQLLFQ